MSWTNTSFLVVFVLIQLSHVARAESISSSSLKASEQEEMPAGRKWSGEWNFYVGGDSFSEGKDEGAAATFMVRSKFAYRFTQWMKFEAKPRMDLYGGRVQERFETDDYKSKIGVSEFSVSVKPVQDIEARAGAIGQEFLHSPLLISGRRAFPGFKEIVGHEFASGSSTLKMEFAAQQVVPTSYSLNSERADKESLPTFNTQSLHFSGKNFDLIEWKLFGGHYNWSNLPDKVAWESGIVGNSVTGDVAPGARFRSGFDGLFGGAEICTCVSQSWLQVVGEFQRVHNDRALAGLGNAQMWGIGPRFVFGERTFEIRYRRYFAEKDATVAIYSRSFLGNTNRMGDNVEFKLDFRDLKFAVVGEWVNAQPIRDNDLQLTMTAFYLGVETHYAPF